MATAAKLLFTFCGAKRPYRVFAGVFTHLVGVSIKGMQPSIWSTPDRNTFLVCTGVDPQQAAGQINKDDHGWIIAGDPQNRPPFKTMYEAASALAGVSAELEYTDYLLAKGEDSRTVFTTAEQMKRIIDEGGWKMVSASAPRNDDVN
jgi:hypothetical protein